MQNTLAYVNQYNISSLLYSINLSIVIVRLLKNNDIKKSKKLNVY